MTQNANDYSYLNVMQALLWLIFFLPFYLLSGLQLFMSPGTVPPSWQPILVPIFLWILFVTFFFTNAIVYVLISLIVIISGIAGFIPQGKGTRSAVWQHKGRLTRIGALLGALSVIGLPWLFPYEAALDPAPGVTMQVLTQPQTPVASFVKNAYVLSNDVPCEYDLLGWSAENELHYRSQCGVREEMWVVHPDRADEPVPNSPWSNDWGKEPGQIRQKVEVAEVLEMLRAEGYAAEPSYREIMLQEGSLRSPDGQWIAAITQHIYGPQDVVLIRAQ